MCIFVGVSVITWAVGWGGNIVPVWRWEYILKGLGLSFHNVISIPCHTQVIRVGAKASTQGLWILKYPHLKNWVKNEDYDLIELDIVSSKNISNYSSLLCVIGKKSSGRKAKPICKEIRHKSLCSTTSCLMFIHKKNWKSISTYFQGIIIC